MEKPSTGQKNLQRLRKEAGFKSAKAFAEELGMSVSTYTHYEQSEENMPLRAAKLAAAALGCSIDEIAGIVRESTERERTPLERKINTLDPFDMRELNNFLEYLIWRRKRFNERNREREAAMQQEALFDYLRAFKENTNPDDQDEFSLSLDASFDDFSNFIHQYIPEESERRIAELEQALEERKAGKTIEDFGIDKRMRIRMVFSADTDDEAEAYVLTTRARIRRENNEVIHSLLEAYKSQFCAPYSSMNEDAFGSSIEEEVDF